MVKLNDSMPLYSEMSINAAEDDQSSSDSRVEAETRSAETRSAETQSAETRSASPKKGEVK